VITPQQQDLDVMGLNLMDPARRVDVLHSAQQTAAEQLRGQLTVTPLPLGRGRSR
jgi:hypothetical protein